MYTSGLARNYYFLLPLRRKKYAETPLQYFVLAGLFGRFAVLCSCRHFILRSTQQYPYRLGRTE